MKTTPGNWSYACDSYGKVQHSKKACIFTTAKGPTGGELSVKVAAEVANWADAQLMSAAKEMYSVLMSMNHMGGDERGGYCICPVNNGAAPHKKHATVCKDARYALAKARNRIYGTGELLEDAFANWEKEVA